MARILSQLRQSFFRNKLSLLKIFKVEISSPFVLNFLRSNFFIDSGDIYGWGWNDSGQIGSCLDDTNEENKVITKENIPKLIFTPSLLNTPLDVCFSDIFAGSRHSAAISDDGNVFTWGWNGYGQLGHGNQEEKLTLTMVKSLESKDVKKLFVMHGALCL